MGLSPGSYTQVAYVVHDLEAAIDGWVQTVGAGPFYTFDNVIEEKRYRGEPATDTNVAAMGFLGATQIEIFQPTNNQPSIYREVLDTRGEGIHHTLPAMRPMSASEFDAECAKHEAAGLTLSTKGTVPHVGRIAFYDARAELGQFIEVIELSPQAYSLMDLMYDAHKNWDGQTPTQAMADLLVGFSG